MNEKTKKTLISILVGLACVVVIWQGIAAGVKSIRDGKDNKTTDDSSTTSTAAVQVVDYEL